MTVLSSWATIIRACVLTPTLTSISMENVYLAPTFHIELLISLKESANAKLALPGAHPKKHVSARVTKLLILDNGAIHALL